MPKQVSASLPSLSQRHHPRNKNNFRNHQNKKNESYILLPLISHENTTLPSLLREIHAQQQTGTQGTIDHSFPSQISRYRYSLIGTDWFFFLNSECVLSQMFETSTSPLTIFLDNKSIPESFYQFVLTPQNFKGLYQFVFNQSSYLSWFKISQIWDFRCIRQNAFFGS